MFGAALRHQEVHHQFSSSKIGDSQKAIPYFGRDNRIRTCDFYVPKMENYGIHKIFYEYCTKNLTLFQRI